jgi:hypothetical protein
MCAMSSLSVLDDGRCIRSNEELDGLRSSVLGNEASRLSARDLGVHDRQCQMRGGGRGKLNYVSVSIHNNGEFNNYAYSLGIGARTNKFDISKVSESLIGLNTDKQRRTTASGDNRERT